MRRWRIAVTRNGAVVADHQFNPDLGDRRVEVMPVPDDAAVERAAKALLARTRVPANKIDEVVQVVLVALEDQ